MGHLYNEEKKLAEFSPAMCCHKKKKVTSREKEEGRQKEWEEFLERISLKKTQLDYRDAKVL